MIRKLYEIYLILCFKILVVFKMVKTVTPVSANTAAAIVARFILVKIKMIILVPIETIKFSLIILAVYLEISIAFLILSISSLQ